MNKQQFLAAIRERISGLPQKDIEESLDFYAEMIDDRVEEGMTEEQAVAAMGSVEEITAQILMDTPLPKLVKATIRPSRGLRAWEIVLLILGAPVWLPLLLAAVIVLLSVYVVLWSVVVSLYASDLCMAAGALTGIVGAVELLLTGNPVQALLFLGAGFVCAGLAILCFFAFNQVTKGVIFLGRQMIRLVKRIFVRKGEFA